MLLEELGEQQCVLVRRAFGVCGDSPVVEQVAVAIETDDGLGVADVDDEEHRCELPLRGDLDVEGYARERDLPVHPLADRSYRSIGCWPCSRPVGDGEDARAGRWAGTDKIECGLHG